MSSRGTWTIQIGGADFADYTDALQPEGMSGGGASIMEIMGYGAAAPAYFNLGNLKCPQSFTLDRTHATNAEAHAWYQTAKAAWTGVADVLLTHRDYAATETTWKLSGAKIDLDVQTPIGISTTTKLHFTGIPILQA